MKSFITIFLFMATISIFFSCYEKKSDDILMNNEDVFKNLIELKTGPVELYLKKSIDPFYYSVIKKIDSKFNETNVISIVLFSKGIDIQNIKNGNIPPENIFGVNCYYFDENNYAFQELFLKNENKSFESKLKTPISSVYREVNIFLYKHFVKDEALKFNQIVTLIKNNVKKDIKWQYDPLVRLSEKAIIENQFFVPDCSPCQPYQNYVTCDHIINQCGKATHETCESAALYSEMIDHYIMNNNIPELANLSSSFQINLQYDLKNRFLNCGEYGKKIISDYYEFSKIEKTQREIPLNLKIKLIEELPFVNSLVTKLNSETNPNDILISKSERERLIGLIEQMKINIKNPRAIEILNNIISRTKEVEGKNIKDIKALLCNNYFK